LVEVVKIFTCLSPTSDVTVTFYWIALADLHQVRSD